MLEKCVKHLTDLGGTNLTSHILEDDTHSIRCVIGDYNIYFDFFVEDEKYVYICGVYKKHNNKLSVDGSFEFVTSKLLNFLNKNE